MSVREGVEELFFLRIFCTHTLTETCIREIFPLLPQIWVGRRCVRNKTFLILHLHRKNTKKTLFFPVRLWLLLFHNVICSFGLLFFLYFCDFYFDFFVSFYPRENNSARVLLLFWASAAATFFFTIFIIKGKKPQQRKSHFRGLSPKSGCTWNNHSSQAKKSSD